MKNRLLFLAFGSIILVGGLHFIATAFYYYWVISWFDNLMHFLGGFSMGLLSLWILYSSGLFKKIIPGKRQAIITSIICVMAIGIGWEIFEYLNGLTQSTESYPLDTFHDLLSDFIGAFIAGGLASQRKFYE
jgi:VanZ family protein